MKASACMGAVALLVLVFAQCKKHEESAVSDQAASALPSLGSHDYPSQNDSLAALGRVMFYDKNLSMNNSVACASCHRQSHAFCDNQSNSAGLNGERGKRNTPGIFNKTTRFFWDGRARSLFELALRPVAEHSEMGMSDFGYLSRKLAGISYYRDLVAKAFGTTDIDSARLNRGLTEFLRNFEFTNCRFRRSLQGVEQLSASEQMGKELFFGKARCSNCHHPEVNGQVPGPYSSGQDFLAFNIGLDENYSDKGIAITTGNDVDEGKFMLPMLFNVEYTYPYMHDGRFATLEDVVEHYNSHIQDHPNLDIHLRDLSKYPGLTPEAVFRKLDANGNGSLEKDEAVTIPPVRLNLTASEKRNLVDFLKSLSDAGIKTDERYSDPFLARSN